eukprot:scaffold84203_cov36-Phaeocystis_antarctica.AAC.1
MRQLTSATSARPPMRTAPLTSQSSHSHAASPPKRTRASWGAPSACAGPCAGCGGVTPGRPCSIAMPAMVPRAPSTRSVATTVGRPDRLSQSEGVWQSGQ